MVNMFGNKYIFVVIISMYTYIKSDIIQLKYMIFIFNQISIMVKEIKMCENL